MGPMPSTRIYPHPKLAVATLGGLPVSDDFNRADQAPPGGSWVNTAPQAGMKVASNRLDADASGGEAYGSAYWNESFTQPLAAAYTIARKDPSGGVTSGWFECYLELIESPSVGGESGYHCGVHSTDWGAGTDGSPDTWDSYATLSSLENGTVTEYAHVDLPTRPAIGDSFALQVGLAGLYLWIKRAGATTWTQLAAAPLASHMSGKRLYPRVWVDDYDGHTGGIDNFRVGTLGHRIHVPGKAPDPPLDAVITSKAAFDAPMEHEAQQWANAGSVYLAGGVRHPAFAHGPVGGQAGAPDMRASWRGVAEMLAAGPAAAWLLDGSGGLVDVSGNGRDASAVGAVPGGGADIAGLGSSTSFDGVDDYVTTPYGTRRNLCTNPRGAVNTTGITNSGYTGLGVVPVAEASRPRGIPTAFTMTGDVDGDRAYWSVPVVSGRTYRFTFYGTSNGSPYPTIANAAGSTQDYGEVVETLPNGWYRWESIFTATATETYRFNFRGVTVGTQLVTGVLIEENDSGRGTYFDGSGYVSDAGVWTADAGGHVGWLSTAHASASDKGCFANGTTRTFVGRAIKATGADTYANMLASANGHPGFLVRAVATGAMEMYVGSPGHGWGGVSGIALDQPFGWGLVVRQPVGTARMFVQGVDYGAGAHGGWGQWPAGLTLRIGDRADYTVERWKGAQAAVAVYERELTAAELAAITVAV